MFQLRRSSSTGALEEKTARCASAFLAVLFLFASLVPAANAQQGPLIDVWYGLDQSFGHLGNPQPWCNILGNVSDPDGVDEIAYSLNGAPEVFLNIGPDNRRLEEDGDFNIDIWCDDMSVGANQVVVRARDDQGVESTVIVDVTYTSGVV